MPIERVPIERVHRSAALRRAARAAAGARDRPMSFPCRASIADGDATPIHSRFFRSRLIR
ncbi:hypothetical protein AQ610_27185 [Burkholderia humptydooensis]|uniref:Uncharacterized protein n=1 Tax=Burkholderia humptydooensis MSMB43 TaxID=441157 RepID=A0ABN0G4M5_9BURK|nr:hypothetical protein AQ610_27185 [Burkholderia humptydooensis]EIP87100.1 hypothetical protein A33K_16703 [Burkholderia humptydooensis MSMB43]